MWNSSSSIYWADICKNLMALLVLYVTFKTVLALDAFVFLIWNY